MDPTSEEEVCSASSIVMSVLPNGKISSVIKLGYGSIQSTTFKKILKMAQNVGLRLNGDLMKALKEENKLGRQKQIFGFLN